MIIKSVTIENFRSFYGEQTINFASDQERNTTLIYAMNGVGKTNLLNGILWCLHNEFSPSFKNENDILNWEASKRGRKWYHVTVTFQEADSEFVVKRTGGSSDSFKVWQDQGGNLVDIKQDPQFFINSIIPRDMAGYFISDGEGSDLTVNSDGMISVRRSIRDILGFHVAEKTIEDLGKIRNEVRAELKKFDKDKELSDIYEKLEVIENSLSEKRNNLGNDKDALETYKIRKDEVDEKLGGASSAQVKSMQQERDKKEREKESAQKELNNEERNKVKLIREYSWVAFSHKLSNEALDFIDESEIKGKIPAPYNMQLVKDILSEGKCICGNCITPGTEAYNQIESLTQDAADADVINRLQRARSRLTAIQTLAGSAKARLDENYDRCHDLRRKVQDLEQSIKEYSDRIEEQDDETINKLEKERKQLETKIYETNRSIGRLDENIGNLEKQKKNYEDQAKRIEGLSPQASKLKEKLEVIEKVEKLIKDELHEAESSIYEVLKNKIDEFLYKYLRQDYKVKMTSDFKIGLADSRGHLVAPGGGQGAILSFMYISSLISIARERRDLESGILTPGAIAPLIFDAPFSKLDPKYAPNVAKELPKLVDQLVILMYQDKGKNVDSTFKDEGRLGKLYYFTEELSSDQGDKEAQEMEVDGVSVPVTVYNAPLDKVVIREERIDE